MRLAGDPTTPPEIPYPYRPYHEPPRRSEPVAVPLVEMPSSDPRRLLFDRRTVLVSGHLDARSVTDLCAELMALDGRSGDDVEMVVNSDGGPLGDVAAILDVLDLMRAKVNATCVGAAKGSAAVLLACASGQRRAGSNSRLCLRLEPHETRPGTADDVMRAAAEHAAEVQRIAARVAAATGQPEATISAELDRGAVHDAATGMALGIVDRVVART